MSLLTGDNGKVLIGAQAVADVTRWLLRTFAETASYASSATAGFRKTHQGNRQGRGHIEFRLDSANPITGDFEEGSAVTLLLHLDATRFYSVPAVIESLEMNVDIDGGDLVGGKAEFVTNGAWIKPSY
jgi:hypothetical protein